MKQTRPHRKRTALAGSTTTLALFASLAFSTTAIAGKDGKGKPGGGDTDPGATINPVPDLVAAPITYELTEIVWPHDIDAATGEYVDGFEGCKITDVNNRGIAVGKVLLPKPADAPADWFSFLYGVINVMLDEQNNIVVDADGRPVASDTWVDLNDLFSEALDDLNSSRSDSSGPWRISSGWQITDAGLIACELLPADQDRQFSRGLIDYYNFDRELTPQIWAVLNLANLVDPLADPRQALSLLEYRFIDPSDPGRDWATDPDQDLDQLTSAGHLQVYNAVVDESDSVVAAINDVFEYDPATSSFVQITPSVSYPYFDDNSGIYTRKSAFSINSSLQAIYRDLIVGDFAQEIYRGTVDGSAPDELWWASENPVLRPMAIAEDGTLYVLARETITKGRNKGQTRDQIYHLLSPTKRTPLVDPDRDGSALRLAVHWRSVSSAPAGEEEIIFRSRNTYEIQIYKPNYESRFVLDLQLPEGADPGDGWDGPFISSPVNQGEGIKSSPSAYYGGYISYNTEFAQESVNFLRTYILTPSQ